MNSFDPTRGFIADYSCLEGGQGLLPPPTGKSSLYLGGSGCSVEMIDLSSAGYLRLAATNAPGSVRTLNNISISHSFPDSGIMLVKRPSTLRQLLTDTVKCAATESSRSDEPVPVYTLPAYMAGTGKYAWADQAGRANIQVESFADVEGNKAKAEGPLYAELRESPQNYQTADKGEKSKASYLKSDRGKRVRYSPEKRRLNRAKTQAKYCASIKGKLARCVASAKHKAFLTALRRGLSKEAARETSERVANERRVQFLKDLLTSTIK